MITDVDSEALKYAELGVDSITFHLEASENPSQTILKLKQLGTKVAIAIKPNTPVETAFPFLGDIDMLLIMTVEPGFGGQKLIEGTLEKLPLALKSFNSLYLELEKISQEMPAGSNSARLLTEGVHSIGKKVVEEAAEVWMAAEYQSNEDLALEASQLIYHLQLLLVAKGIPLSDLEERL